jgi:hypothetical protein
MKRLALLGAVALAAGCGGAKPTSDAAELVPPTALSFVALQTDLGSLPRVLDRFPFGPRALKAIREDLKLKRTMGPELDLAIFKAGTVGFTQPADEKAFEASLGPKQVHARIRGWTVFTDNPSLLHLVQHHEGKLSELPAYRDAVSRLPATAVARAYARRAALSGVHSTLSVDASALVKRAKWASAALTAKGNELKLEVHAKGPTGPQQQSSTDLVSQIPAGSVLAFGFGGLGSVRGNLQKVAGVDVQGIVDALGGQAVGYARPGLPFPEVTIASRPQDPQRAVREIGRLIAKLSKAKQPPVTTTVDGVTLHDVALGAVDIYYGTFDGLFVVSNSTDSVSGLRSKGDKLKVAGLPAQTNGFLYLDVEHALPAARVFAKLANQTVPAQVDAGLKPLKTLVAYGTREGDVQSIFAVLQLR